MDQILCSGRHFFDRFCEHIARSGYDAVFFINTNFGCVADLVMSSHFFNSGRYPLVFTDSNAYTFGPEHPCNDGWRNAHCANHNPLFVAFFNRAADFVVNLAVGTFFCGIAKVHGRTHSARKDDTVKILSPKFAQIGNITTGNSCRFG